MNREEKLISYFVGVCVLVLLFVFGSPYYIVNPGETALRIRFGCIVDAQKESGLYSKMPFIDDIVHMNNRICRFEVTTESGLSKDLQTINAGFIINYKIDDAITLYKSIGTDFENIVIEPFARESIKSGLSKYTAEHLVQFRDETKEGVFQDLKAKLKPYNITVVEVAFSDAKFSTDFMHAVERKQIADQDAKTAKNLTEQVKEEAEQKKISADAEAYALNIRKSALTPELIKIKAIEKWDGVLPRVVTSSSLLNIPNI